VFHSRYKDGRKTLITEIEMSSGRTDLDSLRSLMTLKTPESERGAKGRNSEANKRDGKTIG
jgi:hypothetical protein